MRHTAAIARFGLSLRRALPYVVWFGCCGAMMAFVFALIASLLSIQTGGELGPRAHRIFRSSEGEAVLGLQFLGAARFAHPRTLGYELDGWFANGAQEAVPVAPPLFPGSDRQPGLVTYWAGWPAPMLTGCVAVPAAVGNDLHSQWALVMRCDPANKDPLRKVIAIPLKPDWSAVIGNAMFFAMLTLVVELGVRWVLRLQRKRSGRCVWCGYPLAKCQATCPECGKSKRGVEKASAGDCGDACAAKCGIDYSKWDKIGSKC